MRSASICKMSLLALALLPITSVWAAGCTSVWAARSGSSLDDEYRASTQDSDGNLYLAGFEGGRLHVENDWPVGDSRGFVEKHSPDGALIWRRLFNVGAIDIVDAIAWDPPGNRLVVAGRTSGTLSGAGEGKLSLLLATLDIATGSVLAIDQYRDTYPQHPASIAVLPSGDFVVAGNSDTYVEGNAVLGQPTLFVARFSHNAAGSHAFAQQWWLRPNVPGPLTPPSYAYSVSAMNDGSDDVTVTTRSLGRGQGVGLKRLDASGAIVWNAQISPQSSDVAIATQVSRDGRLYVAGTTGLPLAGRPLGNSDGYLMELAAGSGQILWGQQFGSRGADWVWSLAINESGRLFVAGITDGAVALGATSEKNSAYALAFSADGLLLGDWQAALPAPADFVESLSLTPACGNAVLISGQINGELPTLPSLGAADAIVLAARLNSRDESVFESGFEGDDVRTLQIPE